MTVPIPFPDTLPVAWQWFLGLLMVVFPIHLLLMNAMLGFVLLSLYFLLRGGKTDRRLAHELAKGIPVLIALAVNFGVAALLFLQVLYGQFFYTSSVLMAVFWMGVPAFLIVAYYLVYIFDFRFDSLPRTGALLAAFASILFFAIAFLFTNNTTLMIEPLSWNGYFSARGGTLLNTGSGPMWVRYLHIIAGALAVGSLAVAVFGWWKAGSDAAISERAVRTGMHAFTTLTVLQLGLGTWYLASLPRPVMLSFLGGSGTATALMLAGIALAVALVFTGYRRMVIPSAILAVAIVFAMSFLRDAVRIGYLRPFYHPETRVVVPNYAPLIAFGFFALLGAAVIAWMVRKTLAACREAE